MGFEVFNSRGLRGYVAFRISINFWVPSLVLYRRAIATCAVDLDMWHWMEYMYYQRLALAEHVELMNRMNKCQKVIICAIAVSRFER